MKSRIVPILVLLCLPCFARAVPFFTMGEKGPEFDAGTLGRFTFEPPEFTSAAGREEPVFERLDESRGTARYAGGLEVDFEARWEKLVIQFRNGPPDGQKLRFGVRLPISLNQGGSVAFNDQAPVRFPPELGKQFVIQGNAKRITILDASGEGFTLLTPGGYAEVQDTRKFNWAIFGLRIYKDLFGKPEGAFEIEVRPAKAGAMSSAGPSDVPGESSAAKWRVDRFGQSARVDFPGKVRSEEELRADAVREKEILAAHRPDPRFDRYGGLAGSGRELGLKATGFFHVGQASGRTVLVDPEGNAFFQLGVCGIASTDDQTRVKGRESIYEWLPDPGDGTFRSAWKDGRPDWGNFSFYAANWIRKYGRPFSLEEWTGQVVDRLRMWGFNSAGAFSARTEAMRKKNFPYVAFLPLGKSAGLPVLPDKLGAGEVLDPFTPDVERLLDQKFAATVAPAANDPLLIGYFLGNEQHFEDLPKVLPTYKASEVPAKAALVEMLREKYRDIDRFNTAWKVAAPKSRFEELRDEPLFVRTEAASADMAEFSRRFLEAYYGVIEKVFRKHDPNHLLLGSRWTPGTAANREIVEIGGRHLDVVSVNYYTDAIEKGFLERIHQWSGRPILLSEWYYSTTERGLGAGRQVADQAERGSAYRNYVEQSAALPFVVGVQWFIYGDQALTGRFFQGFHGEGNNTGLVDVTDRPYGPLVEAARMTNQRIYDVLLAKAEPFVFDHPRFAVQGEASARRTVQVPRALPGMVLDGTTTRWPGRPGEPIDSNRVTHGLVDENFRADFRLCWDDENLYLHVQVKDPTPGQNTREKDRLWSADCVEIFLGTKEPEASGNLKFSDRQILIGVGNEARVTVVDHPEDESRIQTVLVPDAAGNGYVVQAAIPWQMLGSRPGEDLPVLFDLAVDNSNDGVTRHQQLVWNGTAKNSKSREGWGRAQLTMN